MGQSTMQMLPLAQAVGSGGVSECCKNHSEVLEKERNTAWMERCVGKEKLSRNKPEGVWASAKETSLDRLARGTVASPASTYLGKRDRIQSHDTKLAAASMQDPGKAPAGFWKNSHQGGNRHQQQQNEEN